MRQFRNGILLISANSAALKNENKDHRHEKCPQCSFWTLFSQVETRGATLFVLELARILGKEDCGIITPHEADLLRLLTPIAKLYTAKQVNGINTPIELFKICWY